MEYNQKRPREVDDDDELKKNRFSQIETETQTQLDLSRSLQQLDVDDVIEENVYFDLSKYVHANFKILERDAMLLHHDVDLPFLKYESIPIHENTNQYERVGDFKKEDIIAAGANGFVLTGTYKETPCIAKVLNVGMTPLRSVLQEVLIQAILFEEVNKDECKHCTKIPELFAVLRTSGPMHHKAKVNKKWKLDPSTHKQVVMVIMQRISVDLGSYLHRQTSTRERACVSASVLYQVSNLFMYLQRKHFNFMHADLKTNNITFNIVPRSQGCSRHENRYDTYLIDFGMSSLDYKGVRIGAGMIFRTLRFKVEDYFNPHTDLTYLAWSMWKFQGCDMQLAKRCTNFTILFGRLLQFILLCSGIPFRTVRTFDNISMQTFRSMITAGTQITPEQHAQTPIDFPYVSDESVRKPLAITYAQINHFVKLYMIASASPSQKRKEGAQKQLTRLTNILEEHPDTPGTLSE